MFFVRSRFKLRRSQFKFKSLSILSRLTLDLFCKHGVNSYDRRPCGLDCYGKIIIEIASDHDQIA